MTACTIASAAHPSVTVREGESLLDACLRQGVALTFSCRGGTCQTCLVRSLDGPPPARSQRGLPAHLAARGYFMPCVCHPQEDMQIGPPEPEDFVTECLVDAVHAEAGEVRVRLEPLRALRTQRGQWLRLACGGSWNTRARVVSTPEEGFYLEIALAAPDLPAAWADGGAGQTAQVRPESAREAAPPQARPQPDPTLWHALGEGRVVRQVLDTFYARVFADPLLSPYFRGLTPGHVAGKQYAFLYKAMTGEDVYFGDNPRDAHHWMVISHALFDHRQALMAQAQREHGLTEEQIARWSRFELPYRADIVKDAPWPRERFGKLQPLAGHEQTRLEVGSVCDSCGEEVAAGAQVLVHLRLGTISCARCQAGAA